MEYKLNCAQLRQMAPRLHAGDRVLLSGRVYTSRDAAHKRIVAAMDAGEPLPYDLQDAVIYYAGPTPAPEGLAVGACGPTTSPPPVGRRCGGYGRQGRAQRRRV